MNFRKESQSSGPRRLSREECACSPGLFQFGDFPAKWKEPGVRVEIVAAIERDTKTKGM